MRLRLEKGQCVGHAMCHATDPDLFPIDDDGYCAIESIDLDPSDVERARAGVSACPERALVLDE
ncbi:ferredoxin [Nocardia higoensis]|uniref:ferredoxin n=1 Tax=Nocardia higoensis TaxID=228599 RepID=UPI0005949546|nr:ferredoxin [Nocardia higoensis]